MKPRNFENIKIMPAANGIVVHTWVPDMGMSISSNEDMYVFNEIEDFFEWFVEYAQEDESDEPTGS